jgi:hypothetical protein
VLTLPATAGAQSLYHAWSDRFGDASDDNAYAVATDASDNVLVGGAFVGTVDFGGGVLTSSGARDIFLAKFDAAGNHLWSKNFGDASDYQYAFQVAADGLGNVIVTGTFYGTVDFGGGALTSAGGQDVFIAKFDAGGNHLWSKRFGDTASQYENDVTTDAAGNVIVAGYFLGTMDFGGGALTSAGNHDIYVAKLDPGGNHLWSSSFGDASPQSASGVAVDGAGNVIVTGIFKGTVDFGGGGFTSAGDFDIYVAKFDAAGAHVWSKRYGDANPNYTFSVTTDGLNNIILGGYFYGTVDFGGGGLTSAGLQDIYTVKFDAAGTHLWSKRFGDVSDLQWALGISTDGSDNVIMTGQFEGTVDFGGGALTSAGGFDGYVARFDAAGNHLWSTRFGDSANQYAWNVTADGSGNAIVTGSIVGTTDFGGGPLTSAGGFDAYVAKFWRAAPVIAGVRDVPGDQGGWVNLSWDASGADTPAEHVITQYTTWRAIDPTQVSSLIASGASVVDQPVAGAWGSPDADKPLIRVQRLGGATYYWYLIDTFVAYYLPGYSAPVPTLFDSTSVSTENHYFQVIAHTADPYTFYVSEPATGYSVDNLPPAAPQALAGEQTQAEAILLTWDPNIEADLSHYAVCRGTDPGFTPNAGNLIGEPGTPGMVDDEWRWDAGYHYKVTALDEHGNESEVAYLGSNVVTDAGGSRAPQATYLGRAYPNPFSGSTRIAFGLADAADVSLEVYDVSGRLVRVLVDGNRDARTHEVEWDGKDARGDRVSSGVYFYRLTAGQSTHIRKAVLLR